jgi:hypothetical protein
MSGNTVATSVTSSSPLVLGGAYVDPAVLTQFSYITFEGIANVSVAGLTASLELYNVTAGTVVTTITTTSTTDTFVTSASFSKPNVATIYEARAYISDASSISNKAIINMARIKIT